MGARAYSYKRIKYNVRDKTTTVEIDFFEHVIDPDYADGAVKLKKAIDTVARWNKKRYGTGDVEFSYKLQYYTNGEKE